MRRTAWACFCGMIALTAAASPARGDDWPQWLGPQRDGIWRETGILDKFPPGGPKVLWRVPIAGGYTGPAVVGGKVYVMDRVLAKDAKVHSEALFPRRPSAGVPGSERVLCLNAADGKEIWKHEYDCPYSVSYPAGPRCTPVVAGGKVYALGTEGHLFCLDAEKGGVVWKHHFPSEYGVKAPMWGFSAHPLLDGQKLINMVGGDGTTVVAFDKDTGKELWRNVSSREQGYCPPMIYDIGGKRQLVVWDAEAVHGLDPETGKEYWSHPAPTYQGMSIATPRMVGDSVFVTAYPMTAFLLRPGTGATPEVVWKGDARKLGLFSVFSTPFVENGHIYGASSGGKLACVKADTGERVWETLVPIGGKMLPSADVFLVKNGDRFFIFNEHGDLIIAKLSPKGYEEVSRAKLLEATSLAWGRPVVWSHPAFAGKCAFIRNDKELICVSLAATP